MLLKMASLVWFEDYCTMKPIKILSTITDTVEVVEQQLRNLAPAAETYKEL